MSKSPRIIIVLIVPILLLSFVTGCGKIFNRSDGESNNQSQDQKKDPPKMLTSMEQDTEKMIEQVQTVKDQKDDMKRQQQDQKGEDQKKDTEQNQEKQENQGQEQQQRQNNKQNEGQSGGSEEKQGEGQKQEGEKKDQQPPKIDWPSLEKTIEKLHSDWNTYEVQAQKEGAPQDLRENFELQLDTLTNWIMSHNEDETLKAANSLYQYFPEFLNLYKHNAPPDIKKITYNVRQILIDAQGNNWNQSKERLESIDQAWQTAKARMDKPNQELNQKVEAAIDDFSRVTLEQNYYLTKLKGNVLLKNLQEIK